MRYPAGKIKFEAKKANGVGFASDEARLWVWPFWGNPFFVDATGSVEPVAQPERSHFVGAAPGRTVFSSQRVEDDHDVASLVTLGADLLPLGAAVEIGRFAQSGGVYVANVAVSRDARTAAVLLGRPDGATLEAWSLAEGRRLVSHAVSASVSGVGAVAISQDGAELVALVEGIVHRWPLRGGDAVRAGGEAALHAFTSLGGARRLPIGPDGEVLVQSFPSSLLALVDRHGQVVFRHEQGAYAAPQDGAVAMAMSPDGRAVVAAVGANAASGTPVIEVFDRSGATTRTIEHKCAKNEAVYDVAIDDEGWIALATSHRAEIFAPPGVGKPSKKK